MTPTYGSTADPVGLKARRRALPIALGDALWAMLLGVGSTSALASTPASGPALEPSYVEFDPHLLRGSAADGPQVDLSSFAWGNPVPAGLYVVDIFVNSTFRMRGEVRFVDADEGRTATPCFTAAQMARFDLDPEDLSAQARAWLSEPAVGEASDCQRMPQLLPDASARYDFSEQRIDVAIPQANLTSRASDAVDPSQWDDGLNAGRLNYNWNLFHSDAPGYTSTNGALQLDAGLNLDRWRFRYSAALIADGDLSRYQGQRAFAQRSLAGIQSRLEVGETFTNGQVFDAFGLRGAIIASDDRMLPASQRGYAPVVRGVARTNALVTVTQGGTVLDQRTVPAGAFEIKDLKPIGYGADLVVTITESDGEQVVYGMPYAAAPQLLRPGASRYSLAVGQATGGGLQYEPSVASFTMQRGVSNRITASGGLIASAGYAALNGGAAFSTPLGGLSVDLTLAQNHAVDKPDKRGGSLRFAYNGTVGDSTNIHIAGYRYSTRHFWSFSDALFLEDQRRRSMQPNSGLSSYFSDRQRDRFDINLSQKLSPGWGNVFVSGSTRSFWNRAGSDTQFQFGHAGSYKRTSFNVSLSRTFSPGRGNDNQVLASVTMPLFGSSVDQPRYLSTRVWDRPGGRQVQSEVSGVAGARQQASYSVFGAHRQSANVRTSTIGANGGYQGVHGQLSAGVTRSDDAWQANVGGSGSLLFHGGGVVAGHLLGETVALVEAKDARGVRIVNAVGAGINGQGYGVVPYLTPFVRNRVQLSPEGASPDVELASTEYDVTPSAGAIVKVEVATSRQRSAVIRAHLPDERPLPFGAEAQDAATGRTLGFVGQGGAMFLRGVEDVVAIRVLLGEGRRCDIPLDDTPGDPSPLQRVVEATCRAPKESIE